MHDSGGYCSDILKKKYRHIYGKISINTEVREKSFLQHPPDADPPDSVAEDNL